MWGGYVNCKGTQNPITKTINRFKRIITHSRRTHIAESKINLSSLQHYYILELAKTAYRHIMQPDISPSIYHRTITQVTGTHDTRSSTYKN